MFPELEGYTAAVPSKRDLQSFIKVVQTELTEAAVESDVGLVRFVCREIAKAIQLLMTKIEGMIQNVPETKKIEAQKGFARNAPQEHNAQLIALIVQLREAVEKMPQQIAKLLDDSGASVDEKRVQAVRDAITYQLSASIERIDDLATRQLLVPLVDAISDYIKSVMITMHKEGSTISPAVTNPNYSVDTSNQDCSKAVQTILKQFPEILRIHLQSLSAHHAVSWAVEELCKRVLVVFISCAVTVRPVTEISRLRAAADITALDLMVVGIAGSAGAGTSQQAARKSTHQNSSVDRVDPLDAPHGELKALRRLLFEENTIVKGASNPTGTGTDSAKSSANSVPSREFLLNLSYIRALRPSTLLGYLMSCAPAQVNKYIGEIN
jgi:hypothetical protein